MYRLLIVDDEEIITDGLYEVFSRFKREQLDVCKAYSAKEALNWMTRTRIDIVMTDIAMPGMNGLELSEEIRTYWPRCRVVFLTGHSEFDYAYRAIQMANARYLLKTEGYGKVTETVQQVLEDIHRGNLESRLLEQSREQLYAFQFMAQGDYMRHLLQESDYLGGNRVAMAGDFDKLNIQLDADLSVVMVLGRIAYPEGRTYTERSEIVSSVRMLWDTYLSDKSRSMSIVDKHGDLVWFLQPPSAEEGGQDSRFIRYVEGTLELVQEAVNVSLGLALGFTISGSYYGWDQISRHYERLRQLQQLKVGDGLSYIMRDIVDEAESQPCKEYVLTGQKAETMAAYLETGREAEFLEEFASVSNAVLQAGCSVQRSIESYYAVALMLHSRISREGLHGRMDDHGKLLNLDAHSSMREGFHYLRRVAEQLFRFKQYDERDRASLVVDRICHYIEEHLGEDLSLVRLAEIHYFNPTYLSRFFKQEKGINLSEFIDTCRVKKAKELLRDADLKVRDVAVSVGYEAAHSFTRFFKKVTGMTPQEYRDTLAIS